MRKKLAKSQHVTLDAKASSSSPAMVSQHAPTPRELDLDAFLPTSPTSSASSDADAADPDHRRAVDDLLRLLSSNPSLSAAAGINRRGFQGQALGGRGVFRRSQSSGGDANGWRRDEGSEPSPRRKNGARVGAAGKR